MVGSRSVLTKREQQKRRRRNHRSSLSRADARAFFAVSMRSSRAIQWKLMSMNFLLALIFCILVGTSAQEDASCPNPDEKRIGEDLGIAQTWPLEDKTQLLHLIQGARTYMTEKVYNILDYDIVKSCINRVPECAYLAWKGDCHTNTEWMLKNCAPMCHACESLSNKFRCPVDPEAFHLWTPGNGDIERLFQNLISQTTYPVKALSSPHINASHINSEAIMTEEGTDGEPSFPLPWVVMMDNIISPLEAERLIDLGYDRQFETSVEYGSIERASRRTSSTAWCTEECHTDPVVHRITERLSSLVQIPSDHAEYMQLLRYEEDQFYKAHHDYGHYEKHKPQGPRISKGGGTRFSKLGITVEPKVGRVVVWPNTLEDAPDRMDPMTVHEALPVESGEKYAANLWFHLRDFKEPHRNGCSK